MHLVGSKLSFDMIEKDHFRLVLAVMMAICCSLGVNKLDRSDFRRNCALRALLRFVSVTLYRLLQGIHPLRVYAGSSCDVFVVSLHLSSRKFFN
jgi:hypothetical protein